VDLHEVQLLMLIEHDLHYKGQATQLPKLFKLELL